MSRNTKYKRLTIVLLISASVILLNVIVGCHTANNSKETIISPSVSVRKGGAQLWSENCMRCHNIRDPQSYSDAEWQVAMRHMRLRANLTAEEHTEILKFLQAAND